MNPSPATPVPPAPPIATHTLRVGMVGLGMIFDETYRPCFEALHGRGVYDPAFGVCQVELAAVATRTGKRAEAYRGSAAGRVGDFASLVEPQSVEQLLATNVERNPSRSAAVNPVVPTTACAPFDAHQARLTRAASSTVKSTHTSARMPLGEATQSAPCGSTWPTNSSSESAATAAHTAWPILPPAPKTPTRIMWAA